MILYCVRHGESVYNAEGRIQGQSDVPLSPLGRRQGEAVAQALAQEPLEAIFASPLRRAMETAQSLAEATNLEIQTDSRLKELDAGIFQDQLRVDLDTLHPDELARWTSGDLDFVIPGGESRRQLAARGSEALQAIAAEQPGEHVAVVGHGRLLAVTLNALLGPNNGRAGLSLDNGSITTLRTDTGGAWELLDLNRIDHLRGVGLAGQGDL